MTQALRYAAIAAAILCIAIGDTAAARETVRADLRISAPWARASAGKIAEAYVTIKNTGAEPERLLAISSPAAERVELRRYPQLGRVASPQKIKSTEIPPGQTVTLAPTRTVLALVGLKRPLKVGSTVTLTLTFERAGAVSVFAPVVDAETLKPPPDLDDKPAPHKKPRTRRLRR
jgi:copper(I)-binding protein